LIVLFLLAYYPYRRRDGDVIGWLLILFPITRFLMEIIRTDEPGQFGTELSISQWISLGILPAGVALLLWLRTRPARLEFSSPPRHR
jgi:phosphatidylglycerol:prolipoprotein diacylglycerol transferase